MSSTRYAENTRVAASKTVNDILATLVKSGIDEFAQMNTHTGTTILFKFDGVNYKVQLPYPDPNDISITHTPQGRLRNKSDQNAFFQKELDRRMRAFLLVIKAKLVAVEEGIVSFESEFLSYAIMSDGKTMLDHATPALEQVKSQGGSMSIALPGGSK